MKKYKKSQSTFAGLKLSQPSVHMTQKRMVLALKKIRKGESVLVAADYTKVRLGQLLRFFPKILVESYATHVLSIVGNQR